MRLDGVGLDGAATAYAQQQFAEGVIGYITQPMVFRRN
jgi:hypothetical protein